MITGPDRTVDLAVGLRALVVFGARLLVAGSVYTVCAALLVSTSPMMSRQLPLWMVIGATAVVAWVLWVLRRPLDRLADRLVYRGRASGYARTRTLLAGMAATLPIDDVLPQLAATAGMTARSDRAEVRLWVDKDEQWREVWPEPSVPQRDPLTIGLTHLGDDVGEIEVDRAAGGMAATDRRQLDQLAAPAGAALATVRLTYALRRRQAELQRATDAVDASTRRLLGAQRDAQRRLRQDLARRVLPHLDAALACCAPTEADPGAAAEVSADVAAGASADAGAQALDEVRLISRGLFPQRLAEAGLAVSLADWRDASAPAVRLDIGDDIPADTAPDLLTCAYFCVVTALDALAAAEARELLAVIAGDGGQLRMRITGDLDPTASPAELTGWLTPVADRVAAFGGTERVEHSGSAVTVVVGLPVGAPAGRPGAGSEERAAGRGGPAAASGQPVVG